MKPPRVDGLAGHPEELSLPGGVTALLGASVVEHTGAGACRVVSGGGLVAKIGPPDVIAREASLMRTALPVAVPAVVDAGPGWIVVVAEDDDDGPWSAAQLHGALADLAALHDAFEGAVPDSVIPVLRQPFSPDGADRLLERVRRLDVSLPAPLDRLLHNPAPLLEALAAEPLTVLHGDPWPGNVLRPGPERRVWVDWEMASIGPAAADVATWLNQTPRHSRVSAETVAAQLDAVEIYLSSRSHPVDRSAFGRACDAAAVLWFLAFDVPHLPGGRGGPPQDTGSSTPAGSAGDG